MARHLGNGVSVAVYPRPAGSSLDERQRRWLAAVQANRLGHGRTQRIHEVTGLAINTIRRGRRELADDLNNHDFAQDIAIGLVT